MSQYECLGEQKEVGGSHIADDITLWLLCLAMKPLVSIGWGPFSFFVQMGQLSPCKDSDFGTV